MLIFTLLAIAATFTDQGTIKGHKIGYINRIIHSADGALFASVNNTEAIVWDAATKKQLTFIKLDGGGYGVGDIAFSGDKLCVGLSKRITCFDTKTGAPSGTDIALPGEGGINAMAIGDSFVLVSTAGEDGSYSIYGDNVYVDGKRVAQLAKAASSKRVTSDIVLGGDRAVLAISNAAKGVEVYDTKTWKKITAVKAKADANRVALAADASWLVFGGTDRMLHVHDTTTGKLVKEWVAHKGTKNDDIGYLWGVAVTPFGILSASDDEENVRLWDAKTFTQLASTKVKVGRLSAFSASPDGKQIVVGGTATALQVFSLE